MPWSPPMSNDERTEAALKRTKRPHHPLKTPSSRLLGVILISLGAVACQPSSQPGASGISGPADRVLHGGKVFTVNDDQPWAEAVAIKGGKLVYVGDDAGVEGFVGRETIRHDLQGKLVLPGLVDAHTHPGGTGRFSGPSGRLPSTNKADILAAVKAYSEANPDLPWIVMCCWPVRLYGNGKAGPHKRDLDAIVSDRPVWLGSNIGHSIWVNSKALELMGVDRDTADPIPGMALFARDADGELTGWIKESAYRPYRARFFEVDQEANREGIVEFLDYLASHGVTSLFDGGNGYYNEAVYSFLAEFDRAGELPLRYEGTYHIVLPHQVEGAVDELLRLRNSYGGDRLRFNTIKFHFDGTNEIRTGAVLEPYSDDPGNRGNTILSTDELRDFLLRLHEAELDLHLHTVGDRAVRIALDAVEAAREVLGGDLYTRVTVCHLDIIDTADYPRFRQLGVIANYTPAWHGVNVDDPTSYALGNERYSRTLLTQPLLDDGAIVTFSSDSGMSRASPYLGMQIAHNRQYEAEGETAPVRPPLTERLALEDLIKGYTWNGAYQLRMEDQLGSIEVGKLADLVVLDRNLFEIDRYEIHEARPEAVIMEGEIIRGNFDSGTEIRP